MKLRNQIGVSVSLLLLLPSLGWVADGNASQRPRSSDVIASGVVVEKVARNFEAQKAGVRPGDILLRWSCGDREGTIDSPFDVLQIEIEQAYHGLVTLEGLRGSGKQVWTLGSQDWGMTARPAFPPRVFVLYLEGQKLAKAGKLADAVRQWRIAAKLLAPGSASAWLLARLADTLSRAHRWKDSDAAYREATQQDLNAGVKIILVRNWAGGLADHGDWAGVRERYKDLEREIQNLDSGSMLAAHIFGEMGYTVSRHSDLDKAKEYYDKALNIEQRVAPNSSELADTFTQLCDVLWSFGDLAQAQLSCEKALEIHKKVSTNSPGYAWAKETRGLIFTTLGDLAKAETDHREAVDIEERLAPDSLDFAYADTLLAQDLHARGDLDQAAESYGRALRIQRKRAPDSLYVALSLTYLGRVALARGHLMEAKHDFENALKIREKLQNRLDIAESFNDLGVVAQTQGHLKEAKWDYVRALRIWQKLTPGSPDLAMCLYELGKVAQAAGYLEEAENFYSQSQTIWEKAPGTKEYADTLLAIAEIKLQRKQLDAATPFFEKAFVALENQVQRLGGEEDLRSGFRTRYADYYHDYLDLLARQRKPAQAFEVLERSRAQTFRELLASAHIGVGTGVAPELLQQESVLSATIKQKYNRWLRSTHTKEQADAWDREYSDLSMKRRSVEDRIRVGSPAYATLTQPRSLSAQEVQQELLDEDTLLLEYSLGAPRSYVFALTVDSQNVYELPKRAEIEGVARRVRALITVPLEKKKADYYQAAAELSRIVLGRVAAQLQHHRVVIVGDGALQYISFASLPTPNLSDAHVASTENVELLQDHHEVVNLPSASVLAVMRQQTAGRTPAPLTVAVVADPVFTTADARVDSRRMVSGKGSVAPKENRGGTSATSADSATKEHLARALHDFGHTSRSGGSDLPRLVFSRREAEAIINVVPQGQGMKALDFQASRATATSPDLARYRIIHIATHALLNKHPALSGLVLSLVNEDGTPEEDGFLALQDIYNLKLSADLVVLSACETGLGEEVQGEGLVGVTRGFMYAGVPRVVASLWSVDDEATAELMRYFYEAMIKNNLSPAAALRDAQLKMRNHPDRIEWQDPYYWAGFVLQGEWK